MLGSSRLITSAAFAAFNPPPPPTGTSAMFTVPKGFHFGLGGHLPEVAKVRHRDAFIVKDIEGVARRCLSLLVAAGARRFAHR